MSGTMQPPGQGAPPPQGGSGGPAQPQQGPSPIEAALAPLVEAIAGWTQAQQAMQQVEAMKMEAFTRGVQAMEMMARAAVAPRVIHRDENGNPVASEVVL